MRFPPANVQLRRAQLALILAVLVPTLLMTAVSIVMLAAGSSEASSVVPAVLGITFCATAISGYILGSIFVGKGASLVRVQNDFLSSVSHELRTPLTSIGLFIESLQNERLAPDHQGKVLALLRGEVGRLDGLVGRLLELSRMESGAHMFERARLEVAEVVRDAVAAFDASTLARPTPIALDLPPGLAVDGDRATLVRALCNLLMNAWKYTDDDKRIAVEARALGRFVVIAVRDNGIGVPLEERRQLFQEFMRGRRARERGTPGVGLGLAFVRTIARVHRGKVEMIARPDGSTFRLRLRAARPAKP